MQLTMLPQGQTGSVGIFHNNIAFILQHETDRAPNFLGNITLLGPKTLLRCQRIFCRNIVQDTYHDLAKQLSYYLYFFSFLFFSFILDLLYREEYGKVLYYKCHSHMTGSHNVTSHDRSHDRHRKVVHRPCSSCISSVENLTGTLLSSLCQSLSKEQLALFQLRVQQPYNTHYTPGFHYQNPLQRPPTSPRHNLDPRLSTSIRQ